MSNVVGEAIFKHRKKIGMTQDQFGAKFHVSGPAIFKFEKGYVRPSLDVWLKIAEDIKIPRSHAVLMWLKDRLPDEFSNLIDLKQEVLISDSVSDYKPKYQRIDYSKMKTPEDVRSQAIKDKTLPRGLLALFKDKKLWETVKPTGDEVNFCRDAYQTVGAGTRHMFLEAIDLLRRFKGGRR
jgi:DNA-binding XRE family transcriptional regulator